MARLWLLVWVLIALGVGYFACGLAFTPWHVAAMVLAGLGCFVLVWGLFLGGLMLLAYVSSLLERTGSKMRW
ncbi:hypothetical protein B0W47_03210 [Komagataeibacter nataicola]|uniref:Uncharacterized protein n=1 Tax=Komagataeibacter nataicola TaxID=265960 RepID=A0A9N7CJZ4_9PROT|nr:hypothetical protein [Komagataeibacter nataicola]AQU86633.1 hypothetical protein B0W47_03210 [Komagataeibacter nataicola]PYD66785.1 hypothetical protein CDI09_06425 [Komagataeibacter nataicola]WEQ56428.1 hypothetical protein LV564_04905 [Komagataeibacter nataicola]WNM07984.1 hypothetical protein RI056_13530 [Komagataeibacter nataicola]GBR22461.1 hypothetical protein AA0616_2278 [Komagataeibacter nataicola NRIC 0616]